MALLNSPGQVSSKSKRLSLILVIILISFSSVYCAKTSGKETNQWWSTSIAKAWGGMPKTFISDIIGLSALKFLFMMAIPFFFSVFLGAMLVMLFPFPLLTSTSGLAGAAAIGRRSDSSSDDDFSSLISYLGGGTETTPALLDINPPSLQLQTFLQPPPPNFSKVKKRKVKLHKFPVYQKAPRYIPVVTQQVQPSYKDDYDDQCYEKLACEIGKSGGNNLKGVVNEIINGLSFLEKHEWNSAIQAYLKGSQFQGPYGIIRNNVSLPYSTNVPQLISRNGIYPLPVLPTNSCSRYKCSW